MSQNDSQIRSERSQFFDTLKKLNNEFQDEIHRQENAVKKLEQEILDLQFRMSTLNEEKTTLQQRLNSQDLDICLMKKEIENLEAAARLMKEQYDAREREFKNTIMHLSVEKTKAEKKIEETQTALKDLTLGLSKLVGATVTYTSPNLADGSDEDRPDGFSEPFYINPIIADLSDENRPTKLAEDFSELYDNEWTGAYETEVTCDEKEKTQFCLNILKRAYDLCLDTSRDHMNEIKNSFAALRIRNTENEGTDYEYIDRITTTRTVAVQNPGCTKLMADFELLSIQQKKTVLEIRNVFEHWLSESFQRIGTDMIAKEFKLEEQATIIYVRGCMKICWSLCRHEPPVHIHFPETKADLQYDTNMFKPYTKT